MHSNGMETEPPNNSGSGRSVSDLWKLIKDAMRICRAAEPELGIVMARLLNLEMAGVSPPILGGGETADLVTGLRMLIHAHADAQSIAEASSFLPRLELCIGCLTQHVQLVHEAQRGRAALPS